MSPETESTTGFPGAKQISTRSGAIRTIPDERWIWRRDKATLQDTCLSILTLPDYMGELSDFSMFSLLSYTYNKGLCGRGRAI